MWYHWIHLDQLIKQFSVIIYFLWSLLSVIEWKLFFLFEMTKLARKTICTQLTYSVFDSFYFSFLRFWFFLFFVSSFFILFFRFFFSNGREKGIVFDNEFILKMDAKNTSQPPVNQVIALQSKVSGKKIVPFPT